MALPRAAPILNTGMKIPDGTGTVELMIEKMNWKQNFHSFFLPSFFFFPFGKKSFYIYIYRERNETDQTDEHVGIDGGPMLHYVHFFDPQLLLGPSEVGEQTVHLIVSIQITGHELA